LSAISKEHEFVTPPPPGPDNYLPRIAVVGDLAVTNNSSTTFDHLMQTDPSMLLMVGDMSSASNYITTGDKLAAGFAYQPRWDDWGR